MPRALYDPATDYYALLGVASDASTDTIQAAYRRLAKAFHPDLNDGSSVAAARMARINAAKTVLLDPDTRSGYDAARSARSGGHGSIAATAAPAYAGGHGRAGGASATYRTVPGVAARAPAARAQVTSTGRSARRTHSRPGGWPDGQTLLLLAVTLPLLVALMLYVVEAVQVAGRPLRAYPSDLALVPMTRPSAQTVALAAFSVVSSQGPNRQSARTANEIIARLVDGTPEAFVLRAIGRRLDVAAQNRDSEAWARAVADLCALSGHC